MVLLAAWKHHKHRHIDTCVQHGKQPTIFQWMWRPQEPGQGWFLQGSTPRKCCCCKSHYVSEIAKRGRPKRSRTQQKGVNEPKIAQKSENKSMQHCKRPGLKQPSSGTPKSQTVYHPNRKNACTLFCFIVITMRPPPTTSAEFPSEWEKWILTKETRFPLLRAWWKSWKLQWEQFLPWPGSPR